MSDPVKGVPFWLVWNKDGCAPRHMHLTADSAQKEADRLANSNPGVQFFVLAPTSAVRLTALERVTFSDDDGIPF